MLQTSLWRNSAGPTERTRRHHCQLTEAIARPHLPSSRPCSDATGSAFSSSPEFHSHACSRPCGAQAARAAAEQLSAVPPILEAAPENGAFLLAEDNEWVPEAFRLLPGELGPIDRHSDAGESPEAFRCSGCTRPECQASAAAACLP